MAAIPGMGPEDRVDLDKDMGIPVVGTPVGSGSIPGLEDLSEMMADDKSKTQTKRVCYPNNMISETNFFRTLLHCFFQI